MPQAQRTTMNLNKNRKTSIYSSCKLNFIG
jgi:hypothetical protein